MQRKLIKNLLLVLAMVVLCLTVGMTASAETWGDYEYLVLKDGTVTITGYTGDETNLEIPAEIDGKAVTEIKSYAFEPNRPDLVKVTIPQGVTTIGNSAFSLCEYLTSVEIPDSVVNIGERAFAHCHSLENIRISANVTYIGEYAFEGCFSVSGYWVDENNPKYSIDDKGVLYNKDKTILIQYPCSSDVTAYVVPETVTEIGPCGFYYGFNLEEIYIPDSVTIIGERAFEGCFSLKNIDFPKGITKIESSIFSWNVGLKEIFIPDNVKIISEYAILHCYYADKVYIESLDVEIGKEAINIAEISLINLPQDKAIDLFKRALFEGQFIVDENDELIEYLTFHDNSFYVSTIYCHEGSDAETYAIDNGIDYELTHFFEDEWTYDYDNMIRTRKCIHCDELETESIEPEVPAEPDTPVDPDTPVNPEPDTPAEPEEMSFAERLIDLIKAFFELLKNLFGK